MLWRGAADWPAFLTGRTMVIAGGLSAKFVVYPIAEGSRRGQAADQLGGDRPRRRRLDAAAAEAGLEPPRPLRGFDAACAALPPGFRRSAGADRGDRPSSRNTRCATATRCRAGVSAASRCWATRRIRCIRSAPTARGRRCSTPASSPTASGRRARRARAVALRAERAGRRPPRSCSNSRGGPERVIDVLEERAPDGFTDMDACVVRAERGDRARLRLDGRLRDRAGQQSGVIYISLCPGAKAAIAAPAPVNSALCLCRQMFAFHSSGTKA